MLVLIVTKSAKSTRVICLFMKCYMAKISHITSLYYFSSWGTGSNTNVKGWKGFLEYTEVQTKAEINVKFCWATEYC